MSDARELNGLEPALEDTRVGGRELNALEDEYPTEDALVESLRNGDDPSDLSGVGGTTHNRLIDWLQEAHNEAWRERHENDEAYCTEFVAREASDIEDIDFDFAFVCPRCGKGNPLEGDPAGFRNRPFACQRCHWVSLLTAEFIDDFVEESDV